MRWTIKPKPEQHHIQQLAKALNVNELIASLLLHRDIKTFEAARQFFRPTLDHLHDPYMMKDMDIAVARIETAITTQQNILIYGDYDVDGTTSVALLWSYLLTFYPHVSTYIPDRYTEGYGISYQGIDFAYNYGFSLIIALDCGIKAIDKVAYATQKGIDFIICDHHKPGNTIPKAVAVLNPKRDHCAYPYKELCGCGIGFKLIQALASGRNQKIDELIPYLDLVATAIAADIVPITGENRVLCFYGLQMINARKRPGINALIHTLHKEELTLTDVVFSIAPRINAAGRIKHGKYAVHLLTATDINTATKLAATIEIFNTERKNLDQKITEEALQSIKTSQEQQRATTVVYHEKWHKGVIGIVASRLIETYHRPTIVFTRSGALLVASARSVPHFDIYRALEACADYLEQFGGHKYAAGLTLKEQNYPAFKECFETVVSTTIDKRLLSPEIIIDARISLSEITPKLYRILSQFEPFGPGNRNPVFMTPDLNDTGYAKKVGKTMNHLKMEIIQNGSQPIGSIGFTLGDKYPIVTHGKPFNAVYTIEKNKWKGTTNIQLKIKDLQ